MIKIKPLIIVPAYNEALNIEKTIKNIKENTKFDYVIINDCSTDNTKEVCERNNFNIISLPINYGLTSAIQLVMKYAKENNYNIAIQFDGDGQHDAKFLNDIVSCIEKDNVDIAIGSRYVDVKRPFSIRMIGSRLLSFFIKIITLKNVNDPTSGMRAYNERAIDMFNSNASLTPEPDTLVYMLKKGLSIKEIQVEMKEREFGESYLSSFKSIKYMLNMILSILFIRSTTRKDKKIKEEK